MNIAILGATGGTGQELTEQALALGHTVKVLVRSPDKVAPRHDRLEVVKADLLDESASTLAKKLGGSEVVLSALGVLSLGITHFYSDTAKLLVAAARQADVKRVMFVSSVGADPAEHEPWWYLWFVRRLLINYYVDMARERVGGELFDLQGGGLVPEDLDPVEVADELVRRYGNLWAELTSEELLRPEEQRYRIGANYKDLPVNRPLNEVNTYSERGSMAYFFNEENEPNYVPNRTEKGAGYLDNNEDSSSSFTDYGQAENLYVNPDPEGTDLVRDAYVKHAEDDDFGQATTLYRDVFGMQVLHEETNEEQGVREAMVRVGDSGSCIQLLAPLDETSTIAKFLDRSGPGLQQLAYRVTDVEAVSAVLRERGVRLLYDAPRRGTSDSRINFVHPKDAGGVLVELVEPAASGH